MKKTQINLDQWIWTAILRLQLNQSCLSIDSFIDSMNQEHVAHINQTQHHFSSDNGMSDEAINDIRRAIEQYHSPIAYYISFGLDQPGVRSVEMNHRIKHLKSRYNIFFIFSATGFFERGIENLSQLVQNGKYIAAIRVLHDMSGILVRSVDYLIEHVL